MLRSEAAQRRDPAGLFALLSLWLVYTRFLPTLQSAHATLPACPFYALTGHPCPFCGGTRSFAALWRGDLRASFRYLPLGPLLFAATLVVAGYAAWAVITGRRLKVTIPPAVWLIAGAALAASWSLKLFWLGN